MKNSLSKGFTLIELLVVISIISLLASIVLVSLGNARNKAREARIISDVQQARLDINVHYDGFTFPDLLNGQANCNSTNNPVNYMNGNLNSCVAGAANVSDPLRILSDDINNQGSLLLFSVTPSGNAYAVRGRMIISPPQFTPPYFCMDSSGRSNVFDRLVAPILVGQCP